MSSSLSLRLGKDEVFNMEDRVRNKKGRFAKRGVISRTEAATACIAEKRKHVTASAEGHVAATSLAATGPSGKKPFPLEGRRSVHLATLATGLEECQNPSCDANLRLVDCLSETRGGLGTVLDIPCRSCSFVSKVDGDSRVERNPNQRGPLGFVSNRKAALGN